MGLAFMVVFGLVLPWIFGKATPRWPFYVGAPLLSLGLVLPAVLKPVHWVWMKSAHVLGWINTRIILTVFYFVLLLPFAVLMKVFGKSLMPLRADPKAETYWRRQPPTNSNFHRPF